MAGIWCLLRIRSQTLWSARSVRRAAAAVVITATAIPNEQVVLGETHFNAIPGSTHGNIVHIRRGFATAGMPRRVEGVGPFAIRLLGGSIYYMWMMISTARVIILIIMVFPRGQPRQHDIFVRSCRL